MLTALGWTGRGLWLSACAAIVWQVWRTGEFALGTAPGGYLAAWMTASVLGLQALAILVLAHGIWAEFANVRRAGQGSPPPPHLVLFVIVALAMVVALGFAFWLAFPYWHVWIAALPGHFLAAPPPSPGSIASMRWFGFAIGLGLALPILWAAWQGVLPRLAMAHRILGLSGLLRGMAMMAWLRLLAPGRDLLMLAPGPSALPFLALAAILAVEPPHPWLTPIAPAALVLAAAVWSLSAAIPPVCLYLSSSERGFGLFSALCYSWAPRNALTLLDRTGRGHAPVYASEREMWQRSSKVSAGLFYDPTVPRVWSIRSRSRHWQEAAWRLIHAAPLVVLDVRGISEAVVVEARTIVGHGLLHKTVIVAERQGDIAAVPAPVPDRLVACAVERIVTAEQLVEAEWRGDVLQLPRAELDSRQVARNRARCTRTRGGVDGRHAPPPGPS